MCNNNVNVKHAFNDACKTKQKKRQQKKTTLTTLRK